MLFQRNKRWNTPIGIVVAFLKKRCCHSESGFDIPYFNKSCCRAQWQVFVEVASAAALGNKFHTVAKPNQDLRITSVCPPIAPNSASCRPCLTSESRVGTVLWRSRLHGKRAASGLGARPWQTLRNRPSIAMPPRAGRATNLYSDTPTLRRKRLWTRSIWSKVVLAAWCIAGVLASL